MDKSVAVTVEEMKTLSSSLEVDLSDLATRGGLLFLGNQPDHAGKRQKELVILLKEIEDDSRLYEVYDHHFYSSRKSPYVYKPRFTVTVTQKTPTVVAATAKLDLPNQSQAPVFARGKIRTDVSDHGLGMHDDAWQRPEITKDNPRSTRQNVNGNCVLAETSLELDLDELTSKKHPLKLFCVAEVASSETSLKDVESRVSNQDQSPSTAFLPVNDFGQRLLDIAGLGSFADFSLKSGTKSIPCHKLVLAARSDAFKTMLESGLEETKTGELILDMLDEEMLEQFAGYLYNKTSPSDFVQTIDDVKQIFPLADRYHLSELKEYCQYALTKQLDTETAAETCKMAALFNFFNLQEAAEDFIVTNMDKFLDDADLFESLTKERDIHTAVMRKMHGALKRK